CPESGIATMNIPNATVIADLHRIAWLQQRNVEADRHPDYVGTHLAGQARLTCYRSPPGATRRGRSACRCIVRSYTDALHDAARSSGREPGCPSKIVAMSPISTLGSSPISTIEWLADTEATMGYMPLPMRTRPPWAALRGRPSACPTGSVASQTGRLAT